MSLNKLSDVKDYIKMCIHIKIHITLHFTVKLYLSCLDLVKFVDNRGNEKGWHVRKRQKGKSLDSTALV